MIYPDFSYEEELLDKGYTPCGADDVGTCCLAGGLTVAVVIVPLSAVKYLEGKVRDSKKLTKKRREELSELILDICDCSFYSIDNNIIDKINILESGKQAMYGAVHKLSSSDFALIDGDIKLPELKIPYRNIRQGDNKSISIACASIIAKVDRDKRMVELAKKYPGYSFETNMGYGTRAHKNGIVKYGVTPIHRTTFSGVKQYI